MISFENRRRHLLWACFYVFIVSKYLASLCFLVALVLVYRGVSGAGGSDSADGEDVRSRNAVEHIRSAARPTRGGRVNVISEREKTEAAQALLEATRVELEDGQEYVWSKENYQRHLAKLTADDAKKLLEVMFAQKCKHVPVEYELMLLGHSGGSERELPMGDAGNLFKPAQTNVSRVVEGLMALLAEEDFLETTKWLDSLASLKEDKVMAQMAYDYALLAGATQNPREAWRIYQDKCPVWGR